MKKFLKTFILFFVCFIAVYLFEKVEITFFTTIKLLCYSAIIALAYVFVSSKWWKKHILKLKNQ
jgi:uncharacterized membrane protein YagU involved in acid resistance